MQIEIKILNKEFYTGVVGVDFGRRETRTEYNLPEYATSGSAGIDLISTEDVTIPPGEIVQINTGLAMYIGGDYTHKQLSDVFDVDVMGVIVPRSGLGTRGLVLANTIGIIDSDYQGEIVIQAWNRNEAYEDCIEEDMDVDVIKLRAGDRIAQLLFVPVIKASFNVVDVFTHKTERGAGGFGSTNK